MFIGFFRQKYNNSIVYFYLWGLKGKVYTYNVNEKLRKRLLSWRNNYNDVYISPNNNYIVCTPSSTLKYKNDISNGDIVVVDRFTGNYISVMSEHEDAVVDIKINSNETYILSTSLKEKTRKKIVKLWDLYTGKEQFKFPDRVDALTFSEDGKSVFYLNSGNLIQLIIKSGQISVLGEVRSIIEADGQYSYNSIIDLKTLSNENEVVVVTEKESPFIILDLESLKPVFSLRHRLSSVNRAELNPKGDALLISIEDKVLIRDFKSQEIRFKCEAEEGTFIPFSDVLATLFEDSITFTNLSESFNSSKTYAEIVGIIDYWSKVSRVTSNNTNNFVLFNENNNAYGGNNFIFNYNTGELIHKWLGRKSIENYNFKEIYWEKEDLVYFNHIYPNLDLNSLIKNAAIDSIIVKDGPPDERIDGITISLEQDSISAARERETNGIMNENDFQKIIDSLNINLLVGMYCSSFNRSKLALVSRNNNIAHVIDSKNGYLFEVDIHTSPITNLDIDNEGTKLIVGSEDGSYSIWDIESQDLIVQGINFIDHNEDLLMITEGGYYDAPKGLVDLVFYTKGLQVFPFSQFDLKYNRPDIVLDRLGYASPEKIKSYRRAYEKRLQKMGFTEDMLKADFHLPEASILNENDIPVQIEGETLKLNIKATDSKYALDRINVWINNVPIYGVNGISLRDKNTQDYKTEIELQLNEGDNKIEVSVLNQAGAESYKETVYINCTKPAPKPNLYFVGIGVKDYFNEDMNLKFSDKDIRDIAHLYGKNKSYGTVYIDTFLNASATKNILPQIRQRLESTTIHDQVIFMYSGHGILDDSLDYYLTTHDIDFFNPKGKGIPYEAVDELLDNIPARQKLVLIDACNSGEVDKDEMEVDNTTGITAEVVAPKGDMFKKYATKTNSFEMMQELFTDLRRGTGATVISSSSGKYFSFEDKKYQNGVYTYALKLGLEGAADVNGDDEITVSELKEFLYTKVESLTNGKQKPTARQENLEYDFRVW